MRKSILKRTDKNSFFVQGHRESNLSKYLFSENPTYRDKSVGILQIMLVSEDWYIFEIEYEKY